MNDNYSHSNLDIIYITHSIPGPTEDSLEYVALLDDYNSTILDKCLCQNTCEKPNSCYPIVECSSNCTCPAECGNRIVQSGPISGLLIKPCENEQKGLGLFTSEFIQKGTFICEYAGELLTRTQALARIEENEAQNKMNYVFCLNEHTYGRLIQTFVDPSKFGNIGRYINHSCGPNCIVLPVRAEMVIPRLAIFASADILPGDEITFNYSGGGPQDPNLPYNNKVCLCNSEKCTGFMPSEKM